MSTFGGKIQEIPNISVDRFDGINFDSEAYFLSHCHSDHMRGLGSFCFHQHLAENNKCVYASQISCEILKRMHPNIANNLIELALNVPITISLENKSVSVTLIPAGHCPGSVMFLFENDVRILYTGDYRISKNDIKKFQIFYDSFNKVKVIDKIYLDTTFFLKRYSHFPKREASLLEIVKIIEEWINKGRFFYINLFTSAKYGYEYVFNEIFNKLKMPIHVGDDAFKFYSLIPEMDKAVTRNGMITRIHSSCDGFKKICIYAQDAMVKSIKISAFRWIQEDLNEGISGYDDSGFHYVCYSTHASYEEGAALIRFLKPAQIEICVKHDDPNVNKEMIDLIDEHIKEYKIEVKEEAMQAPKLFEIENTKKKRKDRKYGEDKHGLLSSPPRQNFKIPKNTSSKFSEEPKIEESSIDGKLGHSSKLFEEDLSFLFATSAIKSDTSLSRSSTSLQTEILEVIEEYPTTSQSDRVEDSPESILFNIINSKPRTIDTVEDDEFLPKREENEEDRVLLDIINSCTAGQNE